MEAAPYFSDLDSALMRLALTLSETGIGSVSPNPLVGCVIANSDGEVIGEGAHQKFGEAHAEPNAIRDAQAKGHSLEGATVYVTLEPHSHTGKTKPCTELLIEQKIRRCVIAMQDPNPRVNGDGVRRLREAGIIVEVGLLEAEARERNRFFIRHITSGMPFVTLKLATSLDGRSALASGQSRWITSEASRRLVHRMRAEHDAVLVGARTAMADDPELTVRLTQGRQPVRILIDPQMSVTLDRKLFNDEHRSKTIVYALEEEIRANQARIEPLQHSGVRFQPIAVQEDRVDLEATFRQIGSVGIASILVEAGPSLSLSIVAQGLVDELAMFYAPMILGGDAQPAIGPLELHSIETAPRFEMHSIAQVPESNDAFIRFRRAL